jgi:CRP-like cAMP-binding protein
MNVVSTVGYGDMFPMTDIERIFFVLLINSGDALFAVAFGLIAGITMQASNNKSTEVFFNKMHSIKELIRENGGDQNQIFKVEQFFAYSWYLHKSTNMVSIKDLSSKLPYRLSKDVVYYSTKHLLEPMFKSFGSENLIRDVSTALDQTIYLPGDFIILKDDYGEEMYFIAEGSVYILAADKRTVLNTLGQGSYFGEMAIFLESNVRTAYVQAETFCSILILKKSDLDHIKINYPTVAKDITKEARKRATETKEIEEENKEMMWDEYEDPEEEKKNLERVYGTPSGTRTNAFSPTTLRRANSRRHSVEILRTPKNSTQIFNIKQKIRKRQASKFQSKHNILAAMEEDDYFKDEDIIEENKGMKKPQKALHKFESENMLKVQDSVKLMKIRSKDDDTAGILSCINDFYR